MGAQNARQIAESYVKAVTNLSQDQTNACAAASSQINNIRIIGSEDVTVKQGLIRQVASAVAACAQTVTSDVKLQNDINILIQQAVKQSKEALNFNPGNQTSENIIRTAVELANNVTISMANTCNVSAGQANTIDIIDSKKVNVTQDAVEQMIDLQAKCTQNLSSINSIINRVTEDFKQTTEQKQETGWLVILIIIVIVVYFVLIYSQKGTSRTIIIIVGLILLALLIGFYIYLKTKKPDNAKIADATEKSSAETNAVTNATITKALAACTDSKATGYVPTQGFYYTFDEKVVPPLGPFVPTAQIVNGNILPRNRTGGAEGKPQGWQPSAVRQYSELLGVDYRDNEQDSEICFRKDVARPSVIDMAAKLQGR